MKYFISDNIFTLEFVLYFIFPSFQQTKRHTLFYVYHLPWVLITLKAFVRCCYCYKSLANFILAWAGKTLKTQKCQLLHTNNTNGLHIHAHRQAYCALRLIICLDQCTQCVWATFALCIRQVWQGRSEQLCHLQSLCNEEWLYIIYNNISHICACSNWKYKPIYIYISHITDIKDQYKQ